MIIDNRVKECFYIFSKILPIYSESQKRIIEKRLKIKLHEVIPTVFLSLGNDCIDPLNKEYFEGYLNWISQAILYMTGESDEFPETIIDNGSGNKTPTMLK